MQPTIVSCLRPGLNFSIPNTCVECQVWDDIIAAAIYVNPCFNFYHLTGKSNLLFSL